MKLLEDYKKQIIIFTFLLMVLFCVVYIVNYLTFQQKKTSSPPFPQPTSFQIPTSTMSKSEILPSDGVGNLIPTYPPAKGSGVDLESPRVSASIMEINKLIPYLPYVSTYKTTNNKEVSIVIPEKDSQSNSWTLTINIFDLDYELPNADTNYNAEKIAFKETVNEIKTWIKDKGADYNRILINWGETELIQNKSAEWLK